MNYGQHARWAGDHRRCRYQLSVPRAELVAALDGFFEELSASEREEMAAGLDAMDLRAIERFRAAELPSLEQMLDGHHEVLADLFELFDLDVLEALAAPPDGAAGVYFVLASLDETLISAEGVLLSGIAYEVAV